MSDASLSDRFRPRDFLVALSLLSRLPIRLSEEDYTTRSAASVWAFPLVGVVLGLIAGCVGWAACVIGLSIEISAALSLATLIILTGAMHEDGLGDCADGFWGGYTRERRLEIMKDSQIGTYGVLALALFILMRWLGMDEMMGKGFIPAMIGVAAISRMPMAVAMSVMQNAREGGLSAKVGKPPRIAAYGAIFLALLIALACFGWKGIVIFAVAGLAATGFYAIAKRKIGGQTGDVLGASQQTAELAALFAVIALT